MVLNGEYDAANAYESVLTVSVDGQPRCTATLIASKLALTAASCFLLSAPSGLTQIQQDACARGECGDVMVPASSIVLIAGADPRGLDGDPAGGPITSRVKRYETKFLSLEALPLACTRTLCGEGWDLAVLELDPICDHGPSACLQPLGFPTAPPTIGKVVRAVSVADGR